MWNHELTKKLIKESRRTREYFAEECGVAVESLTKYLNGYGRPSKAVLLHLARLLERPVHDLEKSSKRKAA